MGSTLYPFYDGKRRAQWTSPDPDHTLSRTCKRLAAICAPLLFRSISLEEVGSERHTENTLKFGNFVHDLTLIMENGVSNGKVLPIYGLLSHFPNIRHLVVIHDREDLASHTALQRAFYGFPELECVTVQEKKYNPGFTHLPHPNVDVSTTFFHHFLRAVLNVYATRIRSLHLHTLLPLHPDVYLQIRDGLPNLQSLSLAGNIDTKLRGRFEEPAPWASGKTRALKDFTLSCCELHSVYFTRNILSGVYGTHLRTVRIISCGVDHIEESRILPAFTQIPVSIDDLRLHHPLAWELSVMAYIPVLEMSITRPHPQAFLELPNLLEERLPDTDGLSTGFSGLKRLRLSARLASDGTWEKFDRSARLAFEKLKERCELRGIELSLDAVEPASLHDLVCTYIG